MVHDRNSYLAWLAARRGVDVSGTTIDDSGCYVMREGRKVYVLPMPGYGQSQAVTVEELDEAGNVTRSSRIGLKPNGSLALDRAKVRTITGKPDKAAAVTIAPRAGYRGEVLPVGVTVTPPPLAARDALRLTVEGMRAYLEACQPRNADGTRYGAALEPLEASAPVVDVAEPETAPAAILADVVADLEPIEVDDAAPVYEAPALTDRVEEAAKAARIVLQANGVTDAHGDIANRIWMAFVAGAVGCSPDGWTISAGPQRDRKARNRGKVVVPSDWANMMRDRFAALVAERVAPVEPEQVTPTAETAPMAPIVAADSVEAVAADLAALAARVAALQPAAAADRRTPARLRMIRTYLRMRADRERLRAQAAEAHALFLKHREARNAADDRAAQAAREVDRLTGANGRLADMANRANRFADRMGDKRDRATRRAIRLRSTGSLDRAALLAVNARALDLQAQVDRFAPLAAALQALVPPAPPAARPVLVTESGRPLAAAA